MITGLDHVAIAVSDLEQAIARFAEDFGLTHVGTETVADAQTTTAFFPLAGSQIELIYPYQGQGPVAKHLSKRGPGLHHLCFRSDNLTKDMARLSAKGYRFLSDVPRPGAHGTLTAFIHPKDTGGVLIELAQHPTTDPS
jgi:methylmalonyl-CoA/ethylmalonyl-CoA epimerase